MSPVARITPFARTITLLVMIVLLGGGMARAALPTGQPVRAEAPRGLGWPSAPGDTIGPERKTQLKVSYTTYEWWISYWSNSTVLCKIYIEHEGVPTQSEVYYNCGQDLLDLWISTPPCNNLENVATCSGVFIYLVYRTPSERMVDVKLPSPQVWVSMRGCSDIAPYNRCSKLPTLVLTGEEPLPNETIIRIQGNLAGVPFSCAGATCSIPMAATGSAGATLEFWADSSFGDSSQHFQARVRVVAWGDFSAPEQKASDTPLWYVDVLSKQWRGAPLASCSETWQSFPDVTGPPAWLTTPERPEDLKTFSNYYYLAGSLIQKGQVDVSDCADGGMQSQTVASQCGLEKARPAVVAWQNRFDSEIIQVAKDTGIPAQLMKNVFSRESQLWPGMFSTYREAGLGQLTENGADTVLLWNPTFFDQFCPLIYDAKVCQLGFAGLNTDQQTMLRGALVRKVNAACPDCPQGIDLSTANFSIGIFARSMLANCEQVGQILYDTTSLMAGDVSPYVDLWKFTVLNYNAGPGCLANSVQLVASQGLPINWENVANNLEPVCTSGIAYLEDVSKVPGATATPTAQMTRLVTQPPASQGQTTPTPTATPAMTRAVSPTPTPMGSITITATPQDYPYPANTSLPTVTGYP
jgi:hypothetical protein